MFKKLTGIILLGCFILLWCFILFGCKKTTPTPLPSDFLSPITEKADDDTSSTSSFSKSNEDIALECLMNLLMFSALENHNVVLSYPIEVAGENCYKIIITGKLNDGVIYNIGTFAVNVNHYSGDVSRDCIAYWFNNETNQFETLEDGREPFYSNSAYTSPNENYLLETVKMENGNSGLRIVDLITGEFELVTEDRLYGGGIWWSESNRFAVIECQSTFYVDFVIVDTNDLSNVRLSINDNFNLFSTYFPYEHASGGEQYLGFIKWIDDSILQMQFECSPAIGGTYHGEFQYDTIDNTIRNFEFQEGYLPQ